MKYIISLSRTVLITLIITLSTNLYCAGKAKLRDFKYNRFSQFGEDGIIQKIFERIGTTSKVCIEFGAWDGLKYSNTAYLWKFQGWKAILIESDTTRFNELLNNIKGYNCIPINRHVGINKNDSLEAILEQHGINDSIDLLSIDIDGNDYYILNSITKLHPRVIICEHNPTIPAHLDVYQNYGDFFGCSVGALVRLAATKGYSLVAITETNSFFVQNNLLNKFSDFELSLSNIAITDYVKYIIFSYGGQPIIIGQNPTGFAFVLHNQGYPAPLNHKHEILRIKNIETSWPPIAGK